MNSVERIHTALKLGILTALLLAPLAALHSAEQGAGSLAKFSGHPAVSHSTDARAFSSGRKIPSVNYCDQPYIVVTKDGHWVCLLTTGPGKEGEPGQHVAATISADQGRTWTDLIKIEPSSGPYASWVVPLIIPSGRIYAFYTYNGDNVVNILRHGKQARADTLGWMCYKYSDDGGRTWSDRHRISMRVTAVDRGNHFFSPSQGQPREVQMFWGIDKPKIVGGSVIFGFSKRGDRGKELTKEKTGYAGEGFLFRSDNILHEPDPARIHWEMLPEGDLGIRADEFGSCQEEHNYVPLSGNSLYCIYRTVLGFPCHSYSRDGGRTWTKPQPATYTPKGRTIRHPRACSTLWKTANGKYLLWFHNNGTPFQDDDTKRKRLWQRVPSRNLAWLTAGEERDGFIYWSQPELVTYMDSRESGNSYPDLVEQNGRYFIASTRKSEARVREIAPALIEDLWRQSEIKSVAKAGLLRSLDEQQLSTGLVNMPRLPSLAGGGGYTVETWFKLRDLAPGQVLLDSRDTQGRGIALFTADKARLEFVISDGQNSTRWDTDTEVLKPGTLHHVVFIIDGAPKLISVVVDGLLCDGGNDRDRPYGYGRFMKGMSDDLKCDIGDTTGGPKLKVGPMVRHLRLYDRYLRTTEAIGNYRAGCSAKP